MVQTIFEQDVTGVTQAREDDGTSEPNLETLKIESVNFVTPSEHEVICEREHETNGNAIVREHVGHHVDLVVNGSMGPHEDAKLLVDWAFFPPLDQRIEDQFVAAIGVFLPAIQLIIASERYTFLEATIRVGRPSNDIVTKLKAKCHVKVLRDVTF